MKLKASDHYEF